MRFLGTRVNRREDPALVRGEGRFVANLVSSNAAHVVYVVSTQAHADLVSVDWSETALPGVLGVYTAADIDIDCYPQQFAGMNAEMVRPILARDRVRFVGEPIAAVVAETQAQAVDAAAAVVVDYAPRTAIIDPEASLEAGYALFPGIEDPLAFRTEAGTNPDFSRCDVVVTQRMANQRMSAAPIEPRSGLALWDSGRLIHYSASQAVHENKAFLAALYGLDPAMVVVRSPDVGGSFGAKFRAYPEEALLGWFARALDRPVTWTETRTESMQGLGHGRGQVQTVTIGGRSDGTIEMFRNHVIQDSGAYPLIGAFLTRQTQAMLTGVYQIRDAAFVGESVVTNTTPVGAFRGAGRPEATAAIERAVDMFAAECGLDPVDVRSRNFIPAAAFPYETPTGSIYDSGDYSAALDKARAAVGYDELRTEQRTRRTTDDRLMLGIGVATYVEVTATTPVGDFASVELRRDGSFLARSSSTPHGQGHKTVWAMIVAEVLGGPLDAVEVIAADTDLVPRGVVTGGSRSAQVVGSMMFDASTLLLERGRAVAADLLEASVDDIVLDASAGVLHVIGSPVTGLTWSQIAAAADEPMVVESGGASDGQTFPFGAHIAVVEVDTETGAVALLRIVAVDDAGPILNPVIFEGQIHGGLAAGIAQALLEEVRYDDDGNPLTSNFADYSIISAAELPSFELVESITPTPRNLLGVKGIGESGTVGSTVAVQNAVIDALQPLGVRHIDLPLTAERVWRAIGDARQRPNL